MKLSGECVKLRLWFFPRLFFIIMTSFPFAPSMRDPVVQDLLRNEQLHGLSPAKSIQGQWKREQERKKESKGGNAAASSSCHIWWKRRRRVAKKACCNCIKWQDRFLTVDLFAADQKGRRKRTNTISYNSTIVDRSETSVTSFLPLLSTPMNCLNILT